MSVLAVSPRRYHDACASRARPGDAPPRASRRRLAPASTREPFLTSPAASFSPPALMPSANADGHTTRSGRNTQSAYAAPAGMKTGSAPQGTSKSDAVAMAQPADWNPAAAAGHKRRRVDSDGEDGTITPGPNTPATTNSGGTPSKPMKAEHGDAATATAGGGGGGGDKKKKRAAFTAEAASLGYETGTIKNSAFVLLAESGATGMTVAAIVEAATKQGCVRFHSVSLAQIATAARGVAARFRNFFRSRDRFATRPGGGGARGRSIARGVRARNAII